MTSSISIVIDSLLHGALEDCPSWRLTHVVPQQVDFSRLDPLSSERRLLGPPGEPGSLNLNTVSATFAGIYYIRTATFYSVPTSEPGIQSFCQLLEVRLTYGLRRI